MLDWKTLPNLGTNRGMAYIYKIECTVNHKRYIGRTLCPSCRCNTHLKALKHNRHLVEDLQSDFNRYGEENFSFMVLQCYQTPVKHLWGQYSNGYYEKECMRMFRSYDRRYGYNYKDQMARVIKRELQA